MSTSSLHSSHKIIRYKNLKNKAENNKQQDAEILISFETEGNGNSMDKRKIFANLKYFHYLVRNFIIIILFFLMVAVLYYYCTSTLQRNLSKGGKNSSSNISCVPLQNVSKLIIIQEQMADYNTCSDNTTCHALLDTIEHEHDGIKYNFVIGPEGELYIGSGFNCLVNKNESALYVKLLESKKGESSSQFMEIRSRLSEIIDHGILCGKISQDYKTSVNAKQGSILETEEFITEKLCRILNCGKNRIYHVHDPGHEMRKLLQSEFRWTFCGNFSNSLNMKEDRVITVDSVLKQSCVPLQIIYVITVDVVETPEFSCSDDSSCLHTFEKNHDGLKYNFIIGHNDDVYVGLGFNCTAEKSSDNTLKIKVLKSPGERYNNTVFEFPEENLKFLQIVDEGSACGRIHNRFLVIANCNITNKNEINNCKFGYEFFSNIHYLRFGFGSLIYEHNYYNISSEHGRGLVPNTFRYQLCSQNQPFETTTMEPEPSSTSDYIATAYIRHLQHDPVGIPSHDYDYSEQEDLMIK